MGTAGFQSGGASICDLPDGVAQGLGDDGVGPGPGNPSALGKCPCCSDPMGVLGLETVGRANGKEPPDRELFCDPPLICFDALSCRNDNK